MMAELEIPMVRKIERELKSIRRIEVGGVTKVVWIVDVGSVHDGGEDPHDLIDIDVSRCEKMDEYWKIGSGIDQTSGTD